MRTPPTDLRPSSAAADRRGRGRLVLPSAVLVALAGLVAGTGDARPAQATAAEASRAVVIGFDGGDFATVERMVAAGELPNFARFANGTFAPLESTMPSESPTAWASLNTGQNPAKTGVPGFVQRQLLGGEPFPGFGHIELRSGDRSRPLSEVEGTPVPTWGRTTYAVLGGLAAALVAAALLLVLRPRWWIAVPIALGLAVLGAFGAQRLRGWLPERYPVHANPNQKPGLWDLAAQQGLRAVVINPAQAWDQRPTDGVRLLAGLGVPDARGELGDWFVYTTDPFETGAELDADALPPKEGRKTTTAGRVVRVDERGGRLESELLGPRNFWREEQLTKRLAELEKELDDPNLGYRASQPINQEIADISSELRYPRRLAVPLVVEKRADGAEITLGGQTQFVAEGAWSDWFRVRFDLNPLVAVHAITRVKVLALDEPHFRLFVSRLDIDPAKPTYWQPVSAPLEFSKALAAACGSFETYGWSTLTMPFKDGLIDEKTLLEDVEFTLGWREELILHALEQVDWDVFMGVFSTTDRVQHMLYALHDPEHPSHDPARAAERVTFFGEEIALSDAIPAIYRRADAALGKVLDRLRPDDLVVVVSDHGFQSFRWQVDVNRLLAELGFLALRPGLEGATPFEVPEQRKRHRSGRDLGSYVDWQRTRAYSLGMGQVYLNLEGREKHGIVPAAERDTVLAELREALLAARVPGSEQPLVTQVLVTAEDRDGPHLDREADLLIGFATGYGPSWTSRGGGAWLLEGADGTATFDHLVLPNDSPWSGDHVGVDTRNVLGLFLSNRRFAAPEGRLPHLLDVTPTVLDALGVERPTDLDRPPLRALD